MEIKSLGHLVLKCTDRQRSEQFYSETLGFPICARYEQDGLNMTFFTLGNHHDLAVMEVSGDGSTPSEQAVGLDHVAFNIGTSLDDLRDAKSHLEQAGITPDPVDHGVTQSLYFSDPDGNGIELYVDTSDAWREDPNLIAQIGPLTL
jgi:catechol 2,3-dioxygenase